MSETDKDLFGKIDALFEKRAPDVLVDKGLEHEDFPVLTEVIQQARPEAVVVPDAPPPALDRRQMDRRQADRRGEDRRLGDRRESRQAAGGPPRPLASKEEVERLVQAMELRLADLFIRQQLRMEEALRKVLREELGKTMGNDPANPQGNGAAGPRL